MTGDYSQIELRVLAHLGLSPSSSLSTIFKTTGVTTGRFSSSRPNVQNIPRSEPEDAEEPLVEEARRTLLAELLRRCSAAGYTEVRIAGDTVWAWPSTTALAAIIQAMGLDCLHAGTSEQTDEPQTRRDHVKLALNLLTNGGGGFFPLEGHR